MRFLLNNKPPKEWDIVDLSTILDNPDYKENQYIDYKKAFAFYEASDKNTRNSKIAEYKHDICAFANTDGGYLIFGVKEEKAIPIEIVGVEIPNCDTDRFELDLRNKMAGIQPAIPSTNIIFIHMESNKYVVLLEILRGSFAPYVFVDNGIDYRFFLRRGNGKGSMSYNEIRNSYMQSRSLSEQIKEFREERIDFFDEGPFFLMHIIPEGFILPELSKKLYVHAKSSKININEGFRGFCYGPLTPNVDGISYPGYEYDNGLQVQFFNNGIAELYLDIDKYTHKLDNSDNHRLRVQAINTHIKDFSKCYFSVREQLTTSTRLFLGFSFVGCEGIETENHFASDYVATIDREEINSDMIEIYDATEGVQCQEAINNLSMEYTMALGIKYTELYDVNP